MPIKSGTQTVAMIAGTVFAAAGLNLGVLTLRDPAPTSSVEAVGASTDPGTGEAAMDLATVENAVADAEVFAAPTPQALPAPSPPNSTDPPGSVAPTGADGDADESPGDESPGGGSPGDDASEDDIDHGSSLPTMSEPPATNPAPGQPPSAPPIDAPKPPPATSPTTAASTSPPVAPPVVETEYLTYDFTGIAEIVIALHNERSLEFWSATTAPGWVYRVDDNEADKVKIKFQRLSDGEEAEFEVKFEDGELDVKQEA